MDAEAETETEKETDQAAVRTYVPAYQKDEWVEHADELDMSLSEFVRSMVQSGRRGFGPATGEHDATGSTGSTDSVVVESQSGDHRERLLDALAGGGYLSWEELVDRTIGDVEADLEAELQALLDENRVEHSPRNGGYRRIE